MTGSLSAIVSSYRSIPEVASSAANTKSGNDDGVVPAWILIANGSGGGVSIWIFRFVTAPQPT